MLLFTSEKCLSSQNKGTSAKYYFIMYVYTHLSKKKKKKKETISCVIAGISLTVVQKFVICSLFMRLSTFNLTFHLLKSNKKWPSNAETCNLQIKSCTAVFILFVNLFVVCFAFLNLCFIDFFSMVESLITKQNKQTTNKHTKTKL